MLALTSKRGPRYRRSDAMQLRGRYAVKVGAAGLSALIFGREFSEFVQAVHIKRFRG